MLLFDSSKPDEATLTGAIIAPDPETLEDYLRDSISRNVGIVEPEGPPPASPGPSPPSSRATTPPPPDPAEGEEADPPPPPEAAGSELPEGERATPEEDAPLPGEGEEQEPAGDGGTTATAQQQGTREGQTEPPNLPVATVPLLPLLPAPTMIPQQSASAFALRVASVTLKMILDPFSRGVTTLVASFAQGAHWRRGTT